MMMMMMIMMMFTCPDSKMNTKVTKLLDICLQACIDFGVRKFNVNTEVRSAYMNALQTPKKDLIDVMSFARESMQAVVAKKMHIFGSARKAY